MSIPTYMIVLLLAAPSFAAEETLPPANLVAHEWGTFTSVAGDDGNPVAWSPLNGPSDLPCFVIHGLIPKFEYGPSLVRMETPVVYFYAAHPVTVSVHVAFPQGRITEWYPQAANAGPRTMAASRMEWNHVEVAPGENPAFPQGAAASHYYAARNTDAAPIHIGQQQEKMIFYRGVGSFQVPLRAAFRSDGRLEVRNAGAVPIPAAILFENRGGLVGYRVLGRLDDSVAVDAPELNGDADAVSRELAGTLVELGLYPKEAAAMIETWRDSWFEDGMRIFYLFPRATVDSLLPLVIDPAPAGIARVFVGRVEILSPAMRDTIETALAAGDVPALEKYGRFLEPFMSEMQKHHTLAEALAAKAFLATPPSAGAACAQ